MDKCWNGNFTWDATISPILHSLNVYKPPVAIYELLMDGCCSFLMLYLKMPLRVVCNYYSSCIIVHYDLDAHLPRFSLYSDYCSMGDAMIKCRA